MLILCYAPTCNNTHLMDPVHRELLRRHRLELSDQIAVSDTIVHFLYQESVLTHGHLEEIQSQPTSRSRALRLLDLLPSRGPRAFDTFLRSLEEEFVWVKDTLLHDLEVESQQHAANGQAPKDDWHLPDKVLLAVPSDRELSRLASRLGPEWEALLLDLGLSTGELFRCRADHAHSTHGQALAGLVKWRQSQGKAATVHRLVQSLQAVDIHPAVLEEIFHQ